MYNSVHLSEYFYESEDERSSFARHRGINMEKMIKSQTGMFCLWMYNSGREF